jgi:hypothetical protein
VKSGRMTDRKHAVTSRAVESESGGNLGGVGVGKNVPTPTPTPTSV